MAFSSPDSDFCIVLRVTPYQQGSFVYGVTPFSSSLVMSDYCGMLRVGLYVFRPIFNRGFEHAAVVNAERNYDVQIAWVQNWGSKVTNLTTGNRVLFYTTLYLFAIFSELYYQKGFECGL